MAAVFESAIFDIRKYCNRKDPKSVRLFEDAIEYIENQDNSWPFSFENLCDQLELDTDSVREEIRKNYIFN